MINKFRFIDSFEVVNNQMSGKMSIPGLNYLIIYTLNIDGGKSSLSDFDNLVRKSEEFVASKLNSTQVSNIIIAISKNITEAAYEGIGYDYSEQDIFNLANDIKIEKIDFYDEDMVLFLKSENIFSDKNISCQIDYDSSIEDVTIF